MPFGLKISSLAKCSITQCISMCQIKTESLKKNFVKFYESVPLSSNFGCRETISQNARTQSARALKRTETKLTYNLPKLL